MKRALGMFGKGDYDMNLRVVAVLVLLACWAALHSAAAEEIDVTYLDGKKEHGELIEQSAEKIVLRVKVGGNGMDVTIPWTKIQELSNGLTRERVMKKWRESNKDKLCPACNGERQTGCQKCNASGLLAKVLVACKACQGTGSAACTAKGCENGSLTCPGPCLKLSEGKWEKGDENLRWRKITYKGGWKSWSERHLGEVIEMQDGQPVNIGKCKVCNGTTKAACKPCEGSGKTMCAACKGAKEVPDPGSAKKCPDCQAGKKTCAACKGTGLKP